MADKSVIQTTEAACRRAQAESCSVNSQYMKLTRTTPMGPMERLANEDGFNAGWDMAVNFILNAGNCKFEVDHA